MRCLLRSPHTLIPLILHGAEPRSGWPSTRQRDLEPNHLLPPMVASISSSLRIQGGFYYPGPQPARDVARGRACIRSGDVQARATVRTATLTRRRFHRKPTADDLDPLETEASRQAMSSKPSLLEHTPHPIHTPLPTAAKQRRPLPSRSA